MMPNSSRVGASWRYAKQVGYFRNLGPELILPQSTSKNTSKTQSSTHTQLLELPLALGRRAPFSLPGKCTSRETPYPFPLSFQSSGAYLLAHCLENTVSSHKDILTQDIRICSSEGICYPSAVIPC